MPILRQYSMQWLWIHVRETIEEPEWDELISDLQSFTETAVTPAVGIFVVYPGADRPSPVVRERLGAFLREHGGGPTKAVAFVLPSMLARGVLKAMSWVVKLPFEQKSFSDFDLALAWLREYTLDAVVVDELRASYQEAVPPS